MSTQHSSNHAHPVPLKMLVGVWAVLIVLTWATVTAAGLQLGGSLGILIAMGIAAVKSVFVGLIFMHLLWDKGINSLILVSAMLCLFIFIGFVLLDSREYHDDLIPGYAPAITGIDPLSVLAAGGAAADGDGLTGIARGEFLYTATCAVCHGENAEGKKALNSPALHYQSPWYLASQLTKFRAGQRGTKPNDVGGLQMRPMALALPDDAAVQDVAEYVATLDAPASPLTFEADPEAGAAFYAAVCVACHGVDGMGNTALKSPAIAGQHDWYVAAQLRNFRTAQRGYGLDDATGLQMMAMAMTIPNDEMVDNLAAYVSRMGR